VGKTLNTQWNLWCCSRKNKGDAIGESSGDAIFGIFGGRDATSLLGKADADLEGPAAIYLKAVMMDNLCRCWVTTNYLRAAC
jgi:hypothetical protein